MTLKTFKGRVDEIYFAKRWDVVELRSPDAAARWLEENFDRVGLRAIYDEVLHGALPPRHDEEVLWSLARAIAGQSVRPVIVRRPRPPLEHPPMVWLSELAEAEESEEAKPLPTQRDKPTVTWVALRLLGAQGQSYAGAGITVSLPGGQVRPAILDQNSMWRADDVPKKGTCHVELSQSPPRLGAPLDGFEVKPNMQRLPVEGGSVALATGREHVVVVAQPKAACVRLVGMMFALNKAFMLPGALEGIRVLKHMYDTMPGAEVLVVGHTDRTGTASRNLSLSLERADSVAAYLRDDVDVWLKFYSSATDYSRRWGQNEDLAMLAALPRDHEPYYGPHHAEHSFAAAVRRFQEAHLLAASGEMDEATRWALITDYMALDETTLPAETSITTHGCGETFLAVDTADDVPEPENRRVEVFFFREGIDPVPSAVTSQPGSVEYPAWRESVDQERTFRPTAEGLGLVRLITDIEYEAAKEARVSFLLESSDRVYSQLRTPDQHAKSAEGYVDLVFEDVPRLSFLTLSMRDAEGSDQVMFEEIPFAELSNLAHDPDDPLVDPFTLEEIE